MAKRDVYVPHMSPRAWRVVSAHFPYPADIDAACHWSGLPVSAALAMLTRETGGYNVWGHDPVKRGQVWGGRVNRLSWARYVALRRLGYGNQGCGPCQLTSPGLQDAAGARGGCWKPLHNMEIGFKFLHDLGVQTGSWEAAFRRYNGSGEAARAYGRSAAALMAHWHLQLV